MCVCLKKTCKILEGASQRFWKNISNRAKLCPPTDEPQRKLGIEIFIKLNKPGVGHNSILV